MIRTRLSYNTDISYADRATINIVHDNTALTISTDVDSSHSLISSGYMF